MHFKALWETFLTNLARRFTFERPATAPQESSAHRAPRYQMAKKRHVALADGGVYVAITGSEKELACNVIVGIQGKPVKCAPQSASVFFGPTSQP